MNELEEAKFLANELNKLEENAITDGIKNVAGKAVKAVGNAMGFDMSSQGAVDKANQKAQQQSTDTQNNAMVSAAKFLNKNAKTLFGGN